MRLPENPVEDVDNEIIGGAGQDTTIPQLRGDKQKINISSKEILVQLLLDPKLAKYIDVENISLSRLRDVFGMEFVFKFENLLEKLKNKQLAFNLLFKFHGLDFNPDKDSENLKSLLAFLEQRKAIENGDSVILIGESQNDIAAKILKETEGDDLESGINEIKKALYNISRNGSEINPTFQLLDDLVKLTSGDKKLLESVVDKVVYEYENNGKNIVKEFSSIINSMVSYINNHIRNLSGVSAQDLVTDTFFILNIRKKYNDNAKLNSKVVLQFIKLKEQYGDEYAIIDLINKRVIRDSFKGVDNINTYREWFTSKIPIDNINKDQYISKFLYYTQNNEKSLEKIANFIKDNGSDAITVLFQLGSFLKDYLDESLKIAKHILHGGVKVERNLESLQLEVDNLNRKRFSLDDNDRAFLKKLINSIDKIKRNKKKKIAMLEDVIKNLDLKVCGAKDEDFKNFKDIFFKSDRPKPKKFGDEEKEAVENIPKFDIRNKRYDQIKLRFKDLGILDEDFKKIFKITRGHKKRLNKFLYFIKKCNDLDMFLAILNPLKELNTLYEYDFDNNINNLRRKLLVVLKLKNGKDILNKIIQKKDKIKSVEELSRFIETLKKAA